MLHKYQDDKTLVIRGFFLIAGFSTAFLGLALIFLPQFITSLFLYQPVEDSGLFFIRFAGTSLLGFSLLNFYGALKANAPTRFIAAVNIASLAPATLLSFLTLNFGSYIDKNEWLIILEHLVFLTGFIVSLLVLNRR